MMWQRARLLAACSADGKAHDLWVRVGQPTVRRAHTRLDDGTSVPLSLPGYLTQFRGPNGEGRATVPADAVELLPEFATDVAEEEWPGW